MLQQTRAASVVPYWERFLARFPTPAALAGAPLDDLLALWAGLGYYARARHLHRAAQQVVERHGGCVPDDAAALRALSGVGAYTAGAVLSIAFDQPEPVLDGNVTRVLCRWDRLADDPRRPATQRTLWERAGALVRGPRPGALNQALMELGATVCTPRAPACDRCPVADGCLAAALGDAEAFPSKAPIPERPLDRWVAALCRDGDAVWLCRRPPTGLLAGLWELPMVPGDDPAGLGALGLVPRGAGRTIEHSFTHRRWRVTTYLAEAVSGDGPAAPSSADKRLFPLAALADAGLTGPALKALHAWEIAEAPRRRGAGRLSGKRPAGRRGEDPSALSS